MYTYDIYIDPLHYSVNLNASDAKVVWEKDSESALFRKKLDGTFSINNSGNESLFSKLLDLTYCETGILTISRDGIYVISGAFKKKDISVDIDKCFIQIKFDKYDLYVGIDELLDKDFDIIKGNPYKPYDRYTARYNYYEDYEYVTGNGIIQRSGWYTPDGFKNGVPILHEHFLFYPPLPDQVFYPTSVPLAQQSSYTLLTNTVTCMPPYDPNPLSSSMFSITTLWVRATRIYRRVSDTQTTTPTVAVGECNTNEWIFVESTTNSAGETYDKFARPIPVESFTHNILSNEYDDYIVTRELHCPATYIVDLTRGKKLNEVIDSMIFNAFPNGFKSEFFRSTYNPISGKDLSNILIYQKSDCITPSSSDAALRGVTTFKKLMGYLRDMFNVQWAIDSNGDLRIEHRKYWDNGENYGDNTVGIDLTLVYPQSLIGTSAYAYESSIPIQEKFEYGDAFKEDFVGVPINYSPCILKGDTIIYSLNEINTDIVSIYSNNEVSKEGFCLVHCESAPHIYLIFDGVSYYYYDVISEIGILSNEALYNAHLSSANLQDAYWKYGRYLPKGIMNNVVTDFDVKFIKYQKEIVFPYCFDDFDPHKLIRTTLGDGTVKSASFSLKTNWLTVELQYKDSI